ncbi:hypothetical protein CEUSTIGMA_g3692.t1 [Chlamydomonas eustigma]|uniref:Activating signal cointegrator 1 complex subunit 3 n=1 Tax=Chlamydomonas eustigma TaxID=1157962 RepID=A0A250WZI2_9CHLO|nr:hypothetical protein CEUSTIGMA_g3692.t1 [Chlamydomonas eustigma]|eukprot:GAX76248.1 hypothetical protein CEUSTIGMA_g3692.t1 [Chlamydomonas eustigma]
MGKGGALLDDYQVPRLTEVLRALDPSIPAFDVEAEYIARARILDARRQAAQEAERTAGSVSSPSVGPRSDLALVILGPWDKAPRPAREAYEKFLVSVRKLLDGEMSSGELHEAAGLAWGVLSLLSPPEKARGRGNQLVLKPYKDALVGAFSSSINEEHLQELAQLTESLKRWQAQLQNGSDQMSLQGAGRTATGRGSGALGGDTSLEFGADIEWNDTEEITNRVHAGELALDPDLLFLGLALPGGPTAVHTSMKSSFGPSPHELRQMMLGESALGPSKSHPNGSKNTYGGGGQSNHHSAMMNDDEDLGEEYEDGKRLKEINLHWLQRWCVKVAGEAATSVADSVCMVLLFDKGPDEAAAELLEILGDHAFEDVMMLMEQKRSLKSSLLIALAKLKEEMALDEQDEDQAAKMPVYGTGVTVTSTSRKIMAKLQRKEQRKGQKGGRNPFGAIGVDGDMDLLQTLGFEGLLETEKDKSANLVLGNGMEFKIGGEGSGLAARGVLPKGTSRKTFKGYEEVHVPPAKSLPPATEGELVKISELEDWAQLPFKGYKTLNRIQSRIFNTAYNSNENILVCAPTGAGKTNIAMITVLREVSQNIRHGVIQKADFKIVYVAPMKALAAEVTANFSKRLEPLGLVVRELTGDMQLTKKELAETQMIVTTPEKWDVITRKGGDVAIASLVKLLIIDEVHLLNDDRGAVIESLVARTLRQVEASQSMIRIVGLSATLPNYEDVANFLHVSLSSGLFHFDASYRPVPLEMQFIGVSVNNFMARNNMMAEICYGKLSDSLKKGNQVMVFVHSRKDTGKTARQLAEIAAKEGDGALFDAREHERYMLYSKEVKKSRNREVSELFDHGFGIHHAGMLRADRTLTERMFAEGLIKVLVCTATLAWGVNLPAHTVVIKGTQVYDAQKGAFGELGMLDVQQIFGRAGRPQFDTSGEGIIITTHDKLPHYLGMLTHQIPIESKFKAMLVDNLNAEIVLGTVTNVREAVQWLSYTYLYNRMVKNPLVYGLTYQDLALDPTLEAHKRALIVDAAQQLKSSQMTVFDERSGNLFVTELGRVASHYYIRHNSMVTFNSLLKPHMNEGEVLSMIAQSSEFESMMVREEELPELDELVRQGCHYPVKGGPENKHGKINVLMQAYVSRLRIDSFSLTADMMYVSQNVPRIMRALFEICLRRKWSTLTVTLLELCKCFEKRLWPDCHPLRQFESQLSLELILKLEERRMGLDELWDMEARDIGAAVRHPAAGSLIRSCVESFPTLRLDAQLHPITRTVLRVQLTITPDFIWRDRSHGASLRWHILVEDSANEHIYHNELWNLTKRMAQEGEQKMSFTIPIFEPLPSQYYIRAISEDWIGAEAFHTISFKNLILPERMPPHTELLDLDPLPLSSLRNQEYEALYKGRFDHFNPIQTQAFHTLYHTDENVLLGAPTGSGKTISSELALLHMFSQSPPGSKAIYIAPLKALVRERIEDWNKGLCARLDKKMVELTGDYTPDLRALLAADIIICTPEKWDGISRNWQTRTYVKKVALLVIDEIHLLGADRGPILEVIVSRMRYISTQTGKSVRFVGLSTALSNAQDLADWMGVGKAGLFNFKPSVRPVPLEAHIQGFPGKFYCPRMSTMNKPCYAAIQVHSPVKPVLVFVSSRRQTRLTALDLITYAVADERPGQFVNMSDEELEMNLMGVKDANLRHTLQFGIGLHHAGLNDKDRSLVERLFVERKIQVLVATSTLAWGVNTPAHLVVIKGTEFYDAPSKSYVDFPITDVIQMMGRAGRPQYDKHGVAVIMVHEPKKQFYKRFLYEPFPVESSLPGQLANHFNAEVVAGTITCRQDAVDYLTWTFFFRRLLQNPSYYDLEETTAEALNVYLTELVEGALVALEEAGCVVLGGDEGEEDLVSSTTTGRIASFYYLDHTTMAQFTNGLDADMGVPEVLQVLCSAAEYNELPVRHNEDKINLSMASTARLPVDIRNADDPHVKANLLLQAHMSRERLPISDYITDTKSVLDNSLRVLQAIVDVVADKGWLQTTLSTLKLIQCLMQGLWMDDSSLLVLPHSDDQLLTALQSVGCNSLRELCTALAPTRAEAGSAVGQMRNSGMQGGKAGGEKRGQLLRVMEELLGAAQARDVVQVVERLPRVTAKLSSCGPRGPPSHEKKGEVAEVSKDDEMGWEVQVDLERCTMSGKSVKGRARVYAPRFPKVKEEGWYVVIGEPRTQELLVLKRVSIEHRSSLKLHLPHTNGAGKPLSEVFLHVISDSYAGLDMQYQMDLRQKRIALVDSRKTSVTPSGNSNWKSRVDSVVDAANVDNGMAEEDEPNCA